MRVTISLNILPIADQYAAGATVSAEREQKGFYLPFCIIFSVN